MPLLVGVNTYQSSISFGYRRRRFSVGTYQSEYHLGTLGVNTHLIETGGCQPFEKRALAYEFMKKAAILR